MTPDQLPPLPEPQSTLDKNLSIGEIRGAVAHTDAAMTAYGLQCAEAAVERERARCAAVCHDVAKNEAGRRHHYASSVAMLCAVRIELDK